MKKRIIAIMMATMLCLSITACGGGGTTASTETETEYFADTDFISDLAKGLEARWDISDAQDLSTLSDAEYKKVMVPAVQAELDAVDKYQSEKFSDTKLQEYVIQYINALKDQKAALDYVGVDNLKFSDEWQPAYNKRTQNISIFVNTYGLKVSEKYQTNIDELLTNATLVTKEAEQKESIDNWVKSITFNQVEDSYGWRKYEAVVENTTGLNFQYINLSINLIDADGIVIETTYSSFQNISAGAKVKFEFTSDADFVSTDITSTYQLQ